MSPFLNNIAERLLKKFPKDMGNLAIVLPNKRAIIFLKDYLSKKIKTPIFLPTFFSVEEFAEHLSGLKVIDNISLQFQLYKSYQAHPPKKIENFDNFLNWSNILLSDFNDIDRNLVDTKDIFKSLKEVKELEGWDVNDWSVSNDNLTDVQNNYVDFYDRIKKWYIEFNKELEINNHAYQGMAFRKAAEEVKKIKLPWEKVWFVGLNALTKSEEVIIDHLKKENIARIFWDADNFYYKNDYHEAGGFLRKLSSMWQEINFEGVGDYFSKPKSTFNIIGCPRNIAQANLVGDILNNLPEDELNNETAIILADEKLLYPVLNYLPENIRKINVTMGSKLSNTPLYTFFKVLIEMHLNTNKFENNNFYYKDIIKFIENPFFVRICNTKNHINFRKFINKENIIFLNNNLIEKNIKDKKIQFVFKRWKYPSDITNTLKKILEILYENEIIRNDIIEKEIIYSFSKCIDTLNSLLVESKQTIQLKTVQKILFQIIGDEIIPFEGEPLNGVQIMGILESRTLDFKNVIILSVNEGVIPRGKSKTSLIPYDLKKYFRLSTYTESDAIFSYHFYRVLQRAENINLIYNTETEGFSSGEKSRYINQILSEYKASPIRQLVYKGQHLKQKNNHKICIKNNELKVAIEKWAKKGVSPSALNSYKNCQVAFYYKYLANIKKEDEIDEFADESHIGTAIHNSLEKIYKPTILSEDLINKWKPNILKQIELEYKDMLKNSDIDKGKNFLSIQVAKKLTQNFLQKEKEEVSSAQKVGEYIKIEALEEDLKSQIKLDDTIFNLIGRVDRVDKVGNSLRIIDYKTGTVKNKDLNFSDWDELVESNSKEKSFQLLMYAYLFIKNNPKYKDQRVIAGNYSFKNLEDGLITLCKKESKNNNHNILVINDNVIKRFEDQLNKILNNIISNDFIQTSDKEACKWCDYKLICNR